ncbi:MAG: glycoside hydrolase domain-containing protein [Armatimonadota bacterium]
MRAWWADSLDHVFPNAQPGGAPAECRIAAARNEVVSLQCVVLADRARRGVTVEAKCEGLPAPRWRAVGYVPIKRNTQNTPTEELAGPAPGYFPDPLLDLGSLTLEPGQAQPVWFTLHVPPDAKPGSYRGTVLIADGDDRAELAYTVEVAAAVLPEARSLKVTNWFWTDDRAMQHFGVEAAYCESWWRMVEGFLKNQWAHRQNVFWLRPYDWACRFVGYNGQLKIDFGRFDRWCHILRKLGGEFRLEGPFLTVRDGYDGTFEIPVPHVAGHRVDVRRVSCDDPRAAAFLQQFLREYSAHVKAQGMAGRVMIHIGDEPHGAQMEDYARVASIAHQCAPDLPIIEALDISRNFEFFDEHTDVWVPQLGRFDDHTDLIRARLDAGKQVWHYTCLFPRGRYPNRFVDYPLLKTRLLHWINYRWDLGGYLHWGWNAWTPDPFNDLEPEWGGGTTLPAGDAFLVYPGATGVLDSIRYEQMLEGIQDYELLKALGERSPAEAKAIAAEVTPTFTDYVREPARFRKLRERMLRAFG